MRLLLIILILVGCNENMIVRNKNYQTNKDCLCNYEYIQFSNTTWFEDSCNKYNIGDTIK